jgi:hypothetical protein
MDTNFMGLIEYFSEPSDKTKRHDINEMHGSDVRFGFSSSCLWGTRVLFALFVLYLLEFDGVLRVLSQNEKNTQYDNTKSKNISNTDPTKNRE